MYDLDKRQSMPPALRDFYETFPAYVGMLEDDELTDHKDAIEAELARCWEAITDAFNAMCLELYYHSVAPYTGDTVTADDILAPLRDAIDSFAK